MIGICRIETASRVSRAALPYPRASAKDGSFAEDGAITRERAAVDFIDNPEHRRSKLVQLTRKGAARYREMSARFLALASTIGGELNETEVRKTTAVVRQLSADVTARLSGERVE